MKIVRLALLALIASFANGTAVDAQSVEPFYRGRQISMIVGFAPGGGYDLYARTLARHMGKHIPGAPNIIVKNMQGAATVIAANHLYNVSPKDGSEIGSIAPGAALEPMFGTRPTQYDAQKFTWLGSANDEPGVCMAWHASSIETVEDLFRKETILGASGGSHLDFPLALNAVIGTKFKLVRGYTGIATILLAMERGEVQGVCGLVYLAVQSARPDWIAEKKVRTLLQLGLERDRKLSDVPFVMDFVKSEDDKRVLNLVFGWTLMGRAFLAPPGIPAERKVALIKAFDETMKDPAFVEDAAKQRLEVSATTAAQIDRFLADAYATPKPLVERAAKFLTSN